MDAIVLSPKELVVLSSKMGATNLYGIQDPFRGMTKTEILAEVPKILLQLEKKGLASLGFDNAFALTSQCEELIQTCVFCNQYITIDSISSGIVQPKTLFYFRNSEVVILTNFDNGMELRKITGDEVGNQIIASTFSHCVDTAKEDSCTILAQSILEKAQNAGPQQGVEILCGAGCTTAMASALISGLRQQCEYCSLVAVDLISNSLNSLICIITPDGSLRLTLAEPTESMEDSWQLTWMSKDNIRNEVVSFIRDFSPR